ncbi:hypothetical protein DE4585_01746 [Mycobacteroides salmoniphilum]|uniref:Uncharacterized protein n=1 Tax=Mycobacteroides salmoniphilum TaxID=404941 RepID=A0A4R8S1X0_9MYCO|nr:hypothetical protein DE4585_01746 [Mycobacteroides salmoniphilum]
MNRDEQADVEQAKLLRAQLLSVVAAGAMVSLHDDFQGVRGHRHDFQVREPHGPPGTAIDGSRIAFVSSIVAIGSTTAAATGNVIHSSTKSKTCSTLAATSANATASLLTTQRRTFLCPLPAEPRASSIPKPPAEVDAATATSCVALVKTASAICQTWPLNESKMPSPTTTPPCNCPRIFHRSPHPTRGHPRRRAGPCPRPAHRSHQTTQRS